MKVLVVSDTPSHPPLAGNSACIAAYCDLLRAQGHEVEFLLIETPWGRHADSTEAMHARWGDGLHILRQGFLDRAHQSLHHRLFSIRGSYSAWGLAPLALRNRLRELVAQRGIQAVIANYWHLAWAFRGLSGPRRLVYTHDVFGDRFARTTSRWLSTTPTHEGFALSQADGILAIQADEAAYFQTIATAPVYTTYGHFPPTELPVAGTRNLLFLSGPNRINVDGLRRVVQDVLPALRARDERIRIRVGGRICSALADLQGHPGVELHGEVEDPAAFYALGDIALNPVSRGSGLKIKTFEAMAHGRVAVVHPHCVEGIHHRESAPILQAVDASEHIEAILPLLESRDRLEDARARTAAYIRDLARHVEESFRRALHGEPPP